MRPRLLELNLGDEDAWEIGLTCGGTIEVFVEPLALDRSDDAAARFYETRPTPTSRAGGRGAIVTRLEGPRRRQAAACSTTAPSRGPSAIRPSTSASPAEAREAIADGRLAHAVPGGRAGLRRKCVTPPPRCCSWSAPAMWPCRSGPGPHARVPHRRPRRPAALRDPRAVPRRRRPEDRHPVGAVTGYPLVPTTALVLVAHDYKYDLPVLTHALGTTWATSACSAPRAGARPS